MVNTKTTTCVSNLKIFTLRLCQTVSIIRWKSKLSIYTNKYDDATYKLFINYNIYNLSTELYWTSLTT